MGEEEEEKEEACVCMGALVWSACVEARGQCQYLLLIPIMFISF